MRRRTIAALGLLTALFSFSHGGTTNLRITLRPADTTQYSAKPWRLSGDSSRVQLRLDWLYDEPGFRPPSERAKVECAGDRIVVTVSDTSGAERIEYLSSTRGQFSFRGIAIDSVAWAVLDSADNWLRRHPVSGLESLSGRVHYRGRDLRVSDPDYRSVSRALGAIDTLVYGDWRPAFGPRDRRSTDTSRTLYLVGRQAEMSNARGELFASAVARRFRGTRPPNASPVPEETQPYIVDLQLSSDSFAGNPVRKLAALTAAHFGQRLAMVLDSVVLSAPMIQSEIPDGSFMVVTDDTLGFYARDLATIFLSGPLHSPLVVERVERVRGK